MDTDGMLLKPECILDVQCINQNYMSKYDDAHTQFKYIGHHVDMRNGARKPKTSSPRKNPPGYHSAYPNKPYRCQTCRKTFSQQSNLCKHILIHSGLKPYLCDICDKSFTQQANLIKHRRIHTGDKPFECGVCGRCFSQKANLNKHELLHTGEKHFRCEFCDKSFVQQANLERHKRTHTGEKPYSCNICEKRFTQRGNMVKHTLVHCAKKQNNEVNCGSYQFGVPLILSTKEGLFLKRCNL